MKIAILWNQWSAKIATRVLRDCLALQRLAKVNKAPFVVACDSEIHTILTSMGVAVTPDFVSPDLVRVYLLNEDMTDELSERMPECDDTTIINVTPLAVKYEEHEGNDIDPYAGVKLFVDWKQIPNTMDKVQPPKGPSEPMFSPWL